MSGRARYEDVSRRIDGIFERNGVRMTLGGEPTFLPVVPDGAEWSYSAVGPTKLSYARAMAEDLLKNELEGGVDFFSPGKSYPGEVNPRWAIRVLANRDGSPVFGRRARGNPTVRSLGAFRDFVVRELKLAAGWSQMRDSRQPRKRVWALLLDQAGGKWKAFQWPADRLELTAAEGPAGLRLPFQILKSTIPRRALTIEWTGKRLAIFMPPFLQQPFLELLGTVERGLKAAGIGRVEMEGYLPPDEGALWVQVGLTADPGVLEVNLPACANWSEYDFWIRAVTRTAEAAGLRSWKMREGSLPEGTGGGNHLLWGGPSLDENPFFSRPGWIASIVRYWQRHPALAYLFTGCYVGASSQAPRADESARDRYDLEMALKFLESLGAGDHRGLISETLRHLQTDVTGNSHRSEISLDKFWNVGWPAGALGLIEFRAIESLPKAEWMAAVALLWSALGAMLVEQPVRGRLVEFGSSLHDRYFLPSVLLRDLIEVLDDLDRFGFRMPRRVFEEIWEWKFPVVMEFSRGGARLTVRRAHENWPLLCETPVEGGTTSRFVDTSMRRLEFWANTEFARDWEVRVANRPMGFREIGSVGFLAGLRYRETNLYPSLHPGLPPQMPLRISLVRGSESREFELVAGMSVFRSAGRGRVLSPGAPCKPGRRGDLTYDLRIT